MYSYYSLTYYLNRLFYPLISDHFEIILKTHIEIVEYSCMHIPIDMDHISNVNQAYFLYKCLLEPLLSLSMYTSYISSIFYHVFIFFLISFCTYDILTGNLF
jgi:hypothetical protein